MALKISKKKNTPMSRLSAVWGKTITFFWAKRYPLYLDRNKKGAEYRHEASSISQRPWPGQTKRCTVIIDRQDTFQDQIQTDKTCVKPEGIVLGESWDSGVHSTPIMFVGVQSNSGLPELYFWFLFGTAWDDPKLTPYLDRILTDTW